MPVYKMRPTMHTIPCLALARPRLLCKTREIATQYCLSAQKLGRVYWGFAALRRSVAAPAPP